MNIRQKGFTLVEIIVGLVALSIAMTLLAVLIFPQAQRSVAPILQARAASLGQALVEGIASKPFETIDIVDDHYGINSIQDALGTDLQEHYRNFAVMVEVCYSQATGECPGFPTQYKRIEVTVTTPDNQAFTFATIRGNY